jgi:hypothetical protein
MTIEHLVMIEANDGVTEEQAQEVMDGIMGLKDKIPGVLDVKIGNNFTDRAPHISHAAVITLADKAVLAAYGPHPDHQELLKILMPMAKSITIADIEV